mmetsp:Transcript_17688/g.28268  ORF Transcript_17688/g.28268 Transcript_17688/m.28268 type:complete len:436 (-) Transcript_17688:35-1342(-)|eukprot:CAMPEP_0179440780 /NCGR_PEP_ID=MMETSP0799-20121207/24378_1 /TAXON_ID=46947 /ORGANISM="Geminigera cryophila, Strain CCMP2564" /LENGTH=435 /DNA_ID=CAMNT_0021224469 /DNA_START=33 /DNA_END=1340 /DNA_ORIENTATION=-
MPINLRDYEPSDDEGLNALQHNASMEHALGRWLNAYLRVVTEEKGAFNARALDFDDHCIVVAEMDMPAEDQGGRSKSKQIVGVANVGIKPVYFANGQTGRVGFLYGLRVHEVVQGSGVGQQILAWAEQRAARQKCCRIVLTVNDDNKKARRFFERSGYTLASQRILQFSTLLDVGPRPAHAELVHVVSKQNTPDAISDYKTCMRGREMTPHLDSLILCEPFLGVVSAVSADGESRAGALMWNAGLRKGFTASGKIPDLLHSKSWPLIRSSCAALVGVTWAWHMWGLVVAERFTFLALEACVEAVLAYGVHKLYSIVSFAIPRELKTIRFFGYYASGKHGLDLLRAVYWKARQSARDEFKGAGMIVNADAADPYLDSLDGNAAAPKSVAKKKKARTRFLQKDLCSVDTTSAEPTVQIPEIQLDTLCADMFFDPRDI